MIPGFSQEDCDYKIRVETEEETFILTDEELVEYMLSTKESVFIYFSLMRQNEYSSLVLQISLNAIEMPPIMCFDNKSRITFKMVDGTFVSLPYLDEVNCGRQTEHDNTLNNSISEAAFFIDASAAERLKSTQIESMRITSMKTNFDVEFQNVISNKDIPVPIYPKEYFIATLGCIQ
jgi:hypothetical protein